jgi:hypothetical protein
MSVMKNGKFHDTVRQEKQCLLSSPPSMPTLSIKTSQLIASNHFVDEFMARVGASVDSSEFYAAFLACLENIAVTADEDAAMTCHADQSILSKKSKRMSEDSGPVDAVPVAPLFNTTISMPLPLICRPLPADSLGYTILP